MSKPTLPIGIFDSGLGGLSILSEIHRQLPKENIIYFADSGNAPYGEKSPENIIEFSIKNTDFLLSKGCKLIVVACNTATTNAIHILREKFNVPFIGIEPAIKPAAIKTTTKQIGILATKGTLSSELFAQNLKRMSQKTNIIEVVGKGIVEAIENNTVDTLHFHKALQSQLSPFINSNIDHLVLGCSHYPLITNNLKKIFNKNVKIIDSGFAVAKQTKNILDYHKLLNNDETHKSTIDIYHNEASEIALKHVLNQLNIDNAIIH
ncbi:glutamate racemase [Flavobacteriaceae bacterium 14752]|uniref:glutamate racemase n=1 Tax=Mesohalobacter salilacus TaxID=2491711 RepID=UPI000F6409DD|nr:glutamate racemase [Flavobacteriaceae bacterium 14752]